MKYLLDRTPKPILGRGYRECRVTIKEVSIKKDKDGEHKFCSGTVRSNDGDRIVVIKWYGVEAKNPVFENVWVHCSCPYFRYHVEVVDARKNSSSIISSNGRSPHIRNPRMVPHLCKHAVAFAKATYKSQPKLKGLDVETAPKKPPLKPQPKKISPAKPTQLPLFGKPKSPT